MDIEKSLYMSDFMNIRSKYGSVDNKASTHILFSNLYDLLTPKQKEEEVIKVVEDIQEKTIHIFDKGSAMKKEPEDIPMVIEANKQEQAPEITEEIIVEPDNEVVPVEDTDKDEVPTLFDDANEDDDGEDGENNDKSPTTTEDPIEVSGGGRQIKTIMINPNYIAVDN